VNVVYAALQLGGLVALVVAAWLVAMPFGLAVAGAGALLLGAYAEHR